jgi:hypothetical protein
MADDNQRSQGRRVMNGREGGDGCAARRNAATDELMALFEALPDAHRANALAIFRTVLQALAPDGEKAD